MIDLHTHVLPGVDDGCRTLEESVELARAAAADGIRILAATPHVRSDYPTEPATMERLVQEVRAAVAAAGIPIEILPGGELSLDRLELLSQDEVRRFGLGGNPAVALVEFPYTSWPLGLEERIFRLQLTGMTPVLAHPERNVEVQAAPERLARLVSRGVLVQVTAASLEGKFGNSVRSTARTLLEQGLVHLLASDAHTPEVRRVGMAAAAEAVEDGGVAQWLTETVPRALIDGATVPERPPLRPRRKLWRR